MSSDGRDYLVHSIHAGRRACLAAAAPDDWLSCGLNLRDIGRLGRPITHVAGFARGCFRRRQWQGEEEGGALAWFAFEPNAALVELDYFLHTGEAETRTGIPTFRMKTPEGFEHRLRVVH